MSEQLELEAVTSAPPHSDKVRQAIAAAWREHIPGTPFDSTLTWRQAGVDSLKSLQLLLSLEERLGQRLSFDLVTKDMTVDDLIDALSGNSKPMPKDVPRERDLTFFLVPGLYGDEPILAEFRRSLEGELKFETLDPPDLDQPSKVLGDIRRSADFIVKQVNTRQPHGPIYIGGYSMGGLMAYQAANDLIAAGREVKLVCLLDVLVFSPDHVGQRPAAAEKAPASPALLTRLGRRRGENLALHMERLIYRSLYKLRLLEPARRVAVANAHRHDVETNQLRRRRIIRALRGRAMMTWRADPCPAPTLLVTSDDFAKSGSLPRWKKLCPNLTIQAVVGGHHEIFEPAALAALNPALLAAIDETTTQGSRGVAP